MEPEGGQVEELLLVSMDLQTKIIAWFLYQVIIICLLALSLRKKKIRCLNLFTLQGLYFISKIVFLPVFFGE